MFVTSQEKPEKWGISRAGRWKVIKEVVISRFYSTAMFQGWTLSLAQALNQTPVPRKYTHFRYFSSPFKKIFSQGAQQTSHYTWLLNKAVGRWKAEEPGPTPPAQCSQESQSSLKALAPNLKLSAIRKCCPHWTLVANSSRYGKIYPPPVIYDLTSLSLNYFSLPSTYEFEWHDHL